MTKLVAMTFEEASRWIASQERRIEQLETALRDLVDYTDITKHVDADAVTARGKRARDVLGLTAETGVEGFPRTANEQKSVDRDLFLPTYSESKTKGDDRG